MGMSINLYDQHQESINNFLQHFFHLAKVKRIMDFRTSKCTHNERGRCIHCLTRQIKAEKKSQKQQQASIKSMKCTHPPNIKCLKCMPMQQQKKCNHPDFQKCAKCKSQYHYQSFDYFLQKLANKCQHKKPCTKCVPYQSRKTFTIDKSCRNHLPYPQAQCDSCMAPTLTICKQQYSHVKKVIIKTLSVYKILDAELFGILLGTEKEGVVTVEQVYFPKQQTKGDYFISPQEVIGKYNYILENFGYKQVGIIYHSSEIKSLGLMISSLFQDKCVQFQKGHQISKFVTMRLQYDPQDGSPHFQCFMVSDQFQALHKNGFLFEKQSKKDSFDLVTAKGQNLSQLPTFLRQGVQTDQYLFKQIIVWIDTISQQSYFLFNQSLTYPYFNIQSQQIENMQVFMSIQVEDPWTKYKNIQFLLHFAQEFGKQDTQILLNHFIDEPDYFINQKVRQYKQKPRVRIFESHKSIVIKNKKVQ